MDTIMREFTTRHFQVVVKAVEDDDLDLSFDDDGQVRKGLESGEFMAFGVVVTVYCQGREVGRDSLWGCIYKNTDEFMDHRACGRQNRQWAKQGKTGRCGSCFTDLIKGAIADARKTLHQVTQVRVRMPR